MRVFVSPLSWTAALGTCVLLAVTGCGSDVTSPPPANAAVAAQQATAFIEAIKPKRDGRPVIAIVARNEGTETTDFLLTHAVLQRADIAEVHAVAPRSGRVSLYPAFQIEVTRDLASFDQAYPAGADYVIVPAMSEPALDRARDGAILSWLKKQSGHGARIVGVCAGALVVADAGLLDHRRFTTHWYYLDQLRKSHPTAIYVPHQRYVIDNNIATTTGITASVPTMLSLVEAIGGRERARALATEFGVSSWTPVHDSSRFGVNFSRGVSFILNKMAFWRDEDMRVDVVDGMDDIALAFSADAWSRTGHITVQAAAPAPVQLRSGITLIPDAAGSGDTQLLLTPNLKPIEQLDRTLCEIGSRYGISRREWVMMELEYPTPPSCDAS